MKLVGLGTIGLDLFARAILLAMVVRLYFTNDVKVRLSYNLRYNFVRNVMGNKVALVQSSMRKDFKFLDGILAEDAVVVRYLLHVEPVLDMRLYFELLAVSCCVIN